MALKGGFHWSRLRHRPNHGQERGPITSGASRQDETGPPDNLMTGDLGVDENTLAGDMDDGRCHINEPVNKEGHNILTAAPTASPRAAARNQRSSLHRQRIVER